MDYKPYANAKTTPSRKTRKSLRNSTFVANRKLAKLTKRPRNIIAQRDR